MGGVRSPKKSASPVNSMYAQPFKAFMHMTEEKSTEDDDVGFNDNHDGDAEKDIVTFE